MYREPRDQAGLDTTRLNDHRPKGDTSTAKGGSNTYAESTFTLLNATFLEQPNGAYASQQPGHSIPHLVFQPRHLKLRRCSGAGTEIKPRRHKGRHREYGGSTPQPKEQRDQAGHSTAELKRMHIAMWNRQMKNAGNQSNGLASAMQSPAHETKRGPTLHGQQLTMQGERQAWMLAPSHRSAQHSEPGGNDVGDGIKGRESGVTQKTAVWARPLYQRAPHGNSTDGRMTSAASLSSTGGVASTADIQRWDDTGSEAIPIASLTAGFFGQNRKLGAKSEFRPRWESEVGIPTLVESEVGIPTSVLAAPLSQWLCLCTTCGRAFMNQPCPLMNQPVPLLTQTCQERSPLSGTWSLLHTFRPKRER